MRRITVILTVMISAVYLAAGAVSLPTLTEISIPTPSISLPQAPKAPQTLVIHQASITNDDAGADDTTEATQLFFKMVQNMMHWAVTHQTAAEIVYSRADAKMPHMGLTTWKNAPDGRVQKSDTIVAKNYLSDKEVSALNRLSTAFLDFAELRAERQIITTMADWKKQLDEFLALYKYDTLNNAGTISAEQAKEKAYAEYDKFRLIQDKEYLSDFDKEIKVWKEKGLFGED